MWIDYDYRTWKNVEDETLNFSDNVQYGKRAKDYELIFLWGNCMIKTYLTDRCVAGYPCTAEWGVRPLHSIHCSSNYSHPAGGTPCLCPPVSVLSVSLYIQ